MASAYPCGDCLSSGPSRCIDHPRIRPFVSARKPPDGSQDLIEGGVPSLRPAFLRAVVVRRRPYKPQPLNVRSIRNAAPEKSLAGRHYSWLGGPTTTGSAVTASFRHAGSLVNELAGPGPLRERIAALDATVPGLVFVRGPDGSKATHQARAADSCARRTVDSAASARARAVRNAPSRSRTCSARTSHALARALHSVSESRSRSRICSTWAWPMSMTPWHTGIGPMPVCLRGCPAVERLSGVWADRDHRGRRR
jgi:hypothetical protein